MKIIQNNRTMYFLDKLLLTLQLLLFLTGSKEVSSYLHAVKRNFNPLQQDNSYSHITNQISLSKRQRLFRGQHHLPQFLGFQSKEFKKGSPKEILRTGMQVTNTYESSIVPVLSEYSFLNVCISKPVNFF